MQSNTPEVSQFLWSKPLPSGAPFELDVAIPPYLHHLSELGEFWLTSDAVIPFVPGLNLLRRSSH